MKQTLICIAMLALAACAGTPFKWDDARQLKQGMSTKEVTTIMGEPTSISSTAGQLRYVWVFVNSFAGTRTLRVDFKDDKALAAPVIPEGFKD